MAKISLYICASEDGFIADKSGNIKWLPPMGEEGQKNYEDYFSSIDMVIMGSRSYEKVLSFGMGWPYAGKSSYVFSQRELNLERDDVKITKDDPKTFVEKLKDTPEIRKVWLMGGAELTKSFVKEGLVDQIVLFTIPKTLGEGIPLGIDLDTFEKVSDGLVGDFPVREYAKK